MGTTIHATPKRYIHVDTRTVASSRPFDWLRLGWQDLKACSPASLAYGMLMAVLGWILLMMLGSHPYFASAAVSGFLLLAPVMTTGLCELSRIRQAGRSPDFGDSLDVVNREGRALFRFGVILGGGALLWFALSELLLARLFDVRLPSVADTYYVGFLSAANRAQVLWYIGTGALLALMVFLVSIVTVPLIIDRHARVLEAMSASLRVAGANPGPMIVWSGLLVVMTIVGFATLMLGMIVLIPLLGHATWHAYKDLLR
jgi:uncharacterized membrane protein